MRRSPTRRRRVQAGRRCSRPLAAVDTGVLRRRSRGHRLGTESPAAQLRHQIGALDDSITASDLSQARIELQFSFGRLRSLIEREKQRLPRNRATKFFGVHVMQVTCVRRKPYVTNRGCRSQSDRQSARTEFALRATSGVANICPSVCDAQLCGPNVYRRRPTSVQTTLKLRAGAFERGVQTPRADALRNVSRRKCMKYACKLSPFITPGERQLIVEKTQ